MAQDFIGRFEVIAELGRGGMATVFHAYDPDFDRPVAVKVMPREFLHVPDFKTRFQREARIIANLEHDAIVPVYELGEHDNLPFLVMRYMPGGSLSDRIDHEPLSLPEVIRLFDRIAPAIDFAHAQGFVHRDLKPDNILFDQHNNAFIADFGIAKLMHSTSQLTGSGALVGTPAYMSPEQIMDQGEIDHRSDLYSLGVILYEVLTGQMPFLVESAHAYYSAHLNNPVPDIRDVRPDLPPAFSSIIYRAMAKDKDDRYLSAVDLAADIAAALDSEPYQHEFDSLIVDPPSRPRLPYALLGGGVLILGLIGVFLSGVLKPPDPEPVVVRVTATSDSARPDEESSPPPTDEQEVAAPRPVLPTRDDGYIVFESSRDTFPTKDIYVMRADGSDQKRLTINDVEDYEPSWSPDGNRIVFVSVRDGNPEIYTMDTDGLDVVRLTEDDALDGHPDWSPDGTQIVFTSNRDGNTEIYVMDVDGQNVTRLTEDSGRDEEPVWSPDGTQIAFISEQDGPREVYIMDADGSNQSRISYSVSTSSLRRALAPAWDPTGTRIAFISDRTDPDGAIYVWDVGQGTESAALANSADEIPLPLSAPLALTWSPTGQWLVVSGKTGGGGIAQRTLFVTTLDQTSTVILGEDNHQNWNPDWWVPPADDVEDEPDTAAETIDLRTAGWIVYSYASGLETDDQNPDFDIYTMRADGEQITRLTVTDASEENPVWSPDGTQIAYNSNADGNREIYVMDEDGLNQTRLTFSEGSDFGPRWSPDGSQIVFASERDGNREIYVMNADGSNQTRLTNHEGRDYWPDWSPDGTRIVFSSSRIDGVEGVFIMNADGSNLFQFLAADNFARLYPRWSPDGTQIAVHTELPNMVGGVIRCGGTQDTILLNLDGTNRADPTLVTSEKCMQWASWSPDGNYLIGLVNLSVGQFPNRYNIEVHLRPEQAPATQSLVEKLTSVSLEEQFFWPDWKP